MLPEVRKNDDDCRVIPNIHEEVKSKNPTVRIHNAEYLYLLLNLFPEEALTN